MMLYPDWFQWWERAWRQHLLLVSSQAPYLRPFLLFAHSVLQGSGWTRISVCTLQRSSTNLLHRSTQVPSDASRSSLFLFRFRAYWRGASFSKTFKNVFVVDSASTGWSGSWIASHDPSFLPMALLNEKILSFASKLRLSLRVAVDRAMWLHLSDEYRA